MQDIFKPIESVIKEAGKMLLEAKADETVIHQKSGSANFVTDCDIAIQEFLISRFKEIIPYASFFGEEDTDGSKSGISEKGYTFIIDPIDGTTNFMFGYHHSCISVGITFDGKIYAGFVFNPYVDEMYFAVRGKGSYLNGRKLSMDNRPISEGIIAFGCVLYNDDRADLLFETVKEFFIKSLSIRNGGSAALDLCRAASGGNVAYFELRLQPYDYAASSLIIEEAGGEITRLDGTPITLDKPCSIVAGTHKSCEEIRRIYKEKSKLYQ